MRHAATEGGNHELHGLHGFVITNETSRTNGAKRRVAADVSIRRVRSGALIERGNDRKTTIVTTDFTDYTESLFNQKRKTKSFTAGTRGATGKGRRAKDEGRKREPRMDANAATLNFEPEACKAERSGKLKGGKKTGE
ncbi:MAG: hypothetical protein Kow0099_35210 [Candidatus Abyssubacteria bacterium]